MSPILSIVILLFLNYTIKGDVSDYIGVDVSTGLQSSAISDIHVGSIAAKINAKTFKIYNWSNGPSIAAWIVLQSSTPSDIKLMIELWDINSITTAVIDSFLSSYSFVRSNVYCISLGNEPLLHSNHMTFALLSEKLQLFYQHLSTKPEWDHVKITIPFSESIMGKSWPVTDSYFNATIRNEVIAILNILKQYNGPFSTNLYPFYVDGISNKPKLLQYCLGNEPATDNSGYSTMLEAKYHAVWYAIRQAMGDNDIEIIVTETGWPSASNLISYATKSNAEDYIINTLEAMNNPSSVLYQKKVYLFELFDEDNKGSHDGDWERYFGLYDIDGNSKYDIDILQIS